MGPTWGPPGSCRPQMAPWTLLSGASFVHFHVACIAGRRFELIKYPIHRTSRDFHTCIWYGLNRASHIKKIQLTTLHTSASLICSAPMWLAWCRTKWLTFTNDIFKIILWNKIGVSCKIPVEIVPKTPIDNEPALVQNICFETEEATSHYMDQWWPKFQSSYGLIRPQWVVLYSSVF